MKMGENQVDFLGSALIFDVSIDNRNRRHVFKYVLDKIFKGRAARRTSLR